MQPNLKLVKAPPSLQVLTVQIEAGPPFLEYQHKRDNSLLYVLSAFLIIESVVIIYLSA